MGMELAEIASGGAAETNDGLPRYGQKLSLAADWSAAGPFGRP